MKEPAYTAVAVALKLITRSARWRLSISGSSSIPKSGPAVMAINHAGYLDFGFAAWSPIFDHGRYVRFLAKKQVFDHPLAGPLMRSMGHLPVDRNHDPVKALDLAIKALENGELVGLFPEATINPTFVPGKAKTGAVRMAQATGVPVIPVAVWGAHRLLTKGRRPSFKFNVAINVDIGPQMSFNPSEDPKLATGRLMEAVAGQLAAAQRRYPQKPRTPDDAWWLPAHLGGSAPAPKTPTVD